MSNFFKNSLKFVIGLVIVLFVRYLISPTPSYKRYSNYSTSNTSLTSYEVPKSMNVGDIFSFIKQDSSWGAESYKFTERDSCLWIFVSPKFDYTDSALLTHKMYQIGYLYNIEKSTNISGLAMMRIPEKRKSKSRQQSPKFLYGFYKPNSVCEAEFNFLLLAANRQ